MRAALPALLVLALCAGSAHAQCPDLDADGLCDSQDSDMDGDGVKNTADPFKRVKDVESPQLELLSSHPAVQSLPNVVVSGRAQDPGSGVRAVTLTLDRRPGLAYRITPASDGRFAFAALRLKPGPNRVQVSAEDFAGLRSQTAFDIRYLPPIAITVITPRTGTQVPGPTVTIAGTVQTDAEAGEVRVTVAGKDQVATRVRNQVFAFSFPGLPLTPGANRFTVLAQTAYVSAIQAVDLSYRPPESTPDRTAPTIESITPNTTAPLSQARILLQGLVRDDRALDRVLINDVPALLFGTDPRQRSFESWLDLAAIPDGPVPVRVRVVDVAGNTVLRKLSFLRDTSAPVIQLESPQVTGGLAQTADNPLVIRGTVLDRSLSGVEINGQAVSIQPAPDYSYRFELLARLPPNAQTAITIEAWDAARATSQLGFDVRHSAAAALELSEPKDGDRLLLAEGDEQLAVSVVAGNAAANAVVDVALAGRSVSLQRDGEHFSGRLNVAGLSGRHELRAALRVDGNLVAATTARVELVPQASQPLTVLVEPGSGAAGVEPNEAVALHFSKSVRLADLSVTLRETVNGFAYDERIAGQRHAIRRDYEIVPGRLSLLPGDKTAMFYPSRELDYGAEVTVQVEHLETEIARAVFQTRPLPTLLQGFVTDVFDEPVAGVEVALPELDRSTFTDGNGAYSFGLGRGVENDLPAGPQRLTVNANGKLTNLGSAESRVQLITSQLASAPVVRLPVIAATAERTFLRGGSQAILAAGDLVLDLSQASAEFPDLRPEGVALMQFLPGNQLSVDALPSAVPSWVFAASPQGIAIRGPVGAHIKPPLMHGSLAYLPAEGTLCILVGRERASGQLRPIGACRLEYGAIVSARPFLLDTLDYIGVRFAPTQQATLQRYVNGDIDLRRLVQELER